MNTENNYTETDLGNIAPNPRGEFSEAEEYEYLDYVFYKGGSYLCLAELGTTIVCFPPEPGKTTQYWQAVALPGGLTPEYVAMHDRVVNLSEQVSADTEEVRESKENIEGMETNVESMQAQVAENAQATEASKTQAAGYASAAEVSRQAAETSEQNINAQVTGFDTHVSEKTESAEADIEAARIAANAAVVAQQESSVQEVKNKTSQYITEKQTEAEKAIETKAQEYATSVDADIQAVKDAGTTQVGNVNTAGDAQVQNVNTAGTTQIEAVNTAGSAQKKAVEDAGHEALNNIGTGVDSSLTQEGKAADAAATGKAVDELKGDIDEIIGEQEYKDVSVSLNRYIGLNSSFSLYPASSDYSVFYFKLTKNKRYIVNVTGIENFRIGFSDSTPVAGMTLQDGVSVNGTVYEFTNTNYDYAVMTGKMGTEVTITYTVKEYDLKKSIAQLDAEIKTIDGSINDINYKYSSENVIPTSSESFELRGVTITPNGTGAYLLNGTVSESDGYFIYKNENSIPDNIVNGNEYSFSGEIHDGITLSISFFADNSWSDYIGISKAYPYKKVKVPSNATGMRLYLYLGKGSVFDSAELNTYLISTSSAKYVEDIVNEYHKEETPPPLLTIVDDDGFIKFKTFLLPIIQNKHIPISSSVPTSTVGFDDKMMTWDDIIECALEGAEILSHTHGNLSRESVADMTTEEIATDYRKAQALLRNHGIMSETLTFVGDSSNVEKCVEACRRVYRYGLKAGTNKTNYKATINPYGLDRWNIPPNTELQTLKDKIDSLISDGTGWMIWMIHTSDGTFQQSFADVLSEAIDYAISQGLEIGNIEYGTRIYCE